MIRVADNLWVGGSTAPKNAPAVGAAAVLCVANDMRDNNDVFAIEYDQVGLVDGPGNEVTDYCAAMFCLKAMLRRHEAALVYDHDGRRAMVVAAMYLNLVGGQVRPDPMSWSHWPTWIERITIISTYCRDNEVVRLIASKIDQAHVDIFNKMPWGLIEVL